MRMEMMRKRSMWNRLPGPHTCALVIHSWLMISQTLVGGISGCQMRGVGAELIVLCVERMRSECWDSSSCSDSSPPELCL